MLDAWLRAFVLTLLIEAPIALYGFKSVKLQRRLGGFMLANILSHPALWFIFPRFEPYMLWLVVAESAVIVIEWLVYANLFRSMCSQRYALIVSAVANIASTVLGLLLRA